MTAREPAIAECAADWLESMGLEVYEEVRIHDGGRIADLVGVGADSVVVVETKVRLGLDVIEQADRWKPYANAVWAAFADIRTRHRGFERGQPRTRYLAMWLCEQLGIGILSVPDYDTALPNVLVPAQIREARGVSILRERLAPEQRRGASGARAGSTGGGYHTPFRRTATLVAEIVSEHPGGIDIQSLCAEVNARGGHHYGSGDKGFQTQIPILAKRGVIRGVKVAKRYGSRRPTRLVPADVEEASH